MISGAVGPGDHAFSTSSIWQVSIVGGEPRKLRAGAYMAVLSPDESRLAYATEQGLVVSDANGENPRWFVEGGAREMMGSPTWSPDGRRLYYRRVVWDDAGMSTTVESRGLDEATSIVLVRDARATGRAKDSPRIFDKDLLVLGQRLVYVEPEPSPRGRDWNLWELTVDPKSGRPVGAARRVTDWVGFRPVQLSATEDASRLVLIDDRTQGDVWVGALADGGRRLEEPKRLTLDDRHDSPWCWIGNDEIVFESDRSGPGDLFVQGLSDRNARELVLGPREKTAARPTPDGSAVLYWEEHEGAVKRLMRLAVGGGAADLVLEAKGEVSFDCPRRADGPCLLLEQRVAEGRATLSELDPLTGKGKELSTFDLDPREWFDWAISPDGSRLAMVGLVVEDPQVHLTDPRSGRIVEDIALRGTSATLQHVAWSPDGKGLFLHGDTPRGQALFHVDLEGQARVLFEDPTGDLGLVTPSPDGRRLAFRREIWDSNLWTVEGFSTD